MIVLDASVAVAAFLDLSPVGVWAAETMASRPLAAPSHLLVEVASSVRRAEQRGRLAASAVDRAHQHLLALNVRLHPYESVARRAWELRQNLTMYDAAYVALAEALDAPLATLDMRLVRAPGSRCEFLHPG